MARAAEEVGFDSVWVGDHYLYRGDGRPERGTWEAWTLLAGLAAVTERVYVGPLVACLNFHDPAVLAKKAATVDEMSGGRLIFGVGAGWNRPEFDAFGIPFDHRASRFEEAFDIVRRLLDGERVTHDGRWHRVNDVVLLPPACASPASWSARRAPGSSPQRSPTWTRGTRGTTGSATRLMGSQRSGPRSTEACERAGRDPASLQRSACLLVRLGESVRRTPGCPRRHAAPGFTGRDRPGSRGDDRSRRRRADPRVRSDHRGVDPFAGRDGAATPTGKPTG